MVIVISELAIHCATQAMGKSIERSNNTGIERRYNIIG